MRMVVVAVLFAAVFIPTLSASDLVVEGEGLELIAEYNITDDGIIERKDVRTDEIAALAGSFPFNTVDISDQGKGTNRLLFLDGDGAVLRNVVFEDYVDEHIVHLLGTDGCYIVNSDLRLGLTDGDYFLKEVFSPNGELITSFEAEGTVIASRSSELFAVGDYDYMHRLCDDFDIYDKYGKLLGEVEIPVGMAAAAFDKDKDWFIVADHRAIDKKSLPDTPRGTRIFDSEGRLQFTLNPNIYCSSGGSNIRGKILYGSANYIIQIGMQCEYVTNADINDKTGCILEGCKTDHRTYILDVYDGFGNPLWQYTLPDSEYEGHIVVSEDEKRLALFAGCYKELTVFDLSSGDVYYNTSLPEINGWFMEGSISNYSGIVSVDTLTHPDYPNRHEYPSSAIYLIGDGILLGKVGLKGAPGRIRGELSKDGRYLVASYNGHTYIYKINY